MTSPNANIYIERNCDIGPMVLFNTGGHRVGSFQRRAGAGYNKEIFVSSGSWIGARSTLLGGCIIGKVLLLEQMP